MIYIHTILKPAHQELTTRVGRAADPISLDSMMRERLRDKYGADDSIRLYPAQSLEQCELQSPRQIRVLLGPPEMRVALDDMNRFLLAKSTGTNGYTAVEPSTLEKLACDLRRFADWLVSEWNSSEPPRDYLSLTSIHPEQRTTYAYRTFLMKLSGLAASTKNNRISVVRAFYEYLDRIEVLDPISSQRFQSKRITNISYSSTDSSSRIRLAYTTDLRIGHARSPALEALTGKVSDDGIIRPLLPHELEIVVSVLLDVENPVHRLASFLALNCGARLQTVLTLRRSHARDLLKEVLNQAPFALVPVGGEESAQTKNGKRYSLQIPTTAESMVVDYTDILGKKHSIGELLGDYECSTFANERFEKAKKIRADTGTTHDSEGDEYLFLGKNGMPYYLHRDDELQNARKSRRVGGAFKRSFSVTIGPRIQRAAFDAGAVEFSKVRVGFHDLRGTFAEQFLKRSIDLYVESGLDETRAREVALRQTRRALGHSNLETTMRYLRFREESAQLLQANDLYARSICGDSDE